MLSQAHFCGSTIMVARATSWLLLGVVGCAAPAAPPERAPATPPERAPAATFDVDRCDLERVRALVGEPATEAVGKRAQALSGAAMLRWIRPGEPVTSEYMTSRLTIDVDARGRIRGFRCD
jgi:hypothetical protein